MVDTKTVGTDPKKDEPKPVKWLKVKFKVRTHTLHGGGTTYGPKDVGFIKEENYDPEVCEKVPDDYPTGTAEEVDAALAEQEAKKHPDSSAAGPQKKK